MLIMSPTINSSIIVSPNGLNGRRSSIMVLKEGGGLPLVPRKKELEEDFVFKGLLS